MIGAKGTMIERSSMASLLTKLCGLKLQNPLIMASGILGETGASLRRVAEWGAGAVTTKSIGMEPRTGNINPTVVELDYGLLNAMNLPNPGINAFISELNLAIESGVPVIGSIFGKDARDFSQLARKMSKCGVVAIELNLSCPHAKGFGAELGNNPQMILEITSAVRNEVTLPVFVKLTPNTSDIVALAAAAVSGGCDAVVAINTVKGMALSPEMGTPILSAKIGGYSGPAIKPIGLRCVFEIAQASLGIPIIGVGGITTGRDVIEYIMAGAEAVQVGTAISYFGEATFKKLIDETLVFMQANGYESLDQVRGMALKSSNR